MANYQWTGSGNGTSWSDPANWNNTTTNQNPALTPPGSADDVEFSTAATLTTGGGATYSVTVEATVTFDQKAMALPGFRPA